MPALEQRITVCAKDSGSIYERLRKLRGIADLLIALSESPNESRLLRTPTIGLEFLGQEMSVNLDALEQELERLDVVSQRGA